MRLQTYFWTRDLKFKCPAIASLTKAAVLIHNVSLNVSLWSREGRKKPEKGGEGGQAVKQSDPTTRRGAGINTFQRACVYPGEMGRGERKGKKRNQTLL